MPPFLSKFFSQLAHGFIWIVVWAVLCLCYLLVLRGCGWNNASVGAFALYWCFFVFLPGLVATSWVLGRSLTLTQVLALAVPTGYALEILLYLACSKLGYKGLFGFYPLLWVALAIAGLARTGSPPLRIGSMYKAPLIALSLTCLFCASTCFAVSQLYAETPMLNGGWAHPIFHDWTYLLGRIAEIKHRWPLEDPGMAGNALQYHYFMLVHVAAASDVTGLSIPVVFLRLCMIPLVAVLLSQGFILGKAVSGSNAGGVLAALLTTAASELSFSTNYLNTTYLSIFSRWLYHSPTFFFGVVFFGTIVLAVWIVREEKKLTYRHVLWLILLAIAGTGAKGTVIPTVLCSFAWLTLWLWVREGHTPWRKLNIGLCLFVPFVVVYIITMYSWGTGEASFSPMTTLKLSAFWREFVPEWKFWLGNSLPSTLSSNIAALTGCFIVFIGSAGLRAFALPFIMMEHEGRRRWLIAWLGTLFLCSYLFGILLHLDSYSQLYILELMRLPMAALASAFLIRMLGKSLEALKAEKRSFSVLFTRRMIPQVTGLLLGALFVALVLGVQLNNYLLRSSAGFARWTKHKETTERDFLLLSEAMLWVKNNTEIDSVLVSNVFTLKNWTKNRTGISPISSGSADQIAAAIGRM